jgi:hypothetical protein
LGHFCQFSGLSVIPKGGECFEEIYDPKNRSLQQRLPASVPGKTLNCPHRKSPGMTTRYEKCRKTHLQLIADGKP